MGLRHWHRVTSKFLSMSGSEPTGRRLLIAAATLSFLVTAFLLVVSVRAADFTGAAGEVVGGNTLWVCNKFECQKFRICGINAPQAGEPSHPQARHALSKLVKGKTVRCVQVGGGMPCDGRSKPTNRDRIVAQCFAGDNASWNKAMPAIGPDSRVATIHKTARVSPAPERSLACRSS